MAGAPVPVVAGALVPFSMALLGTVVPGVRTIFAAGGIVATIQSVSTGSSFAAGIGGGAIGAASGVVSGAARRTHCSSRNDAGVIRRDACLF